LDRASDTLVVTAPPPGLVSVGGYRFAQNEIDGVVRRASPRAFVTALPDALAGHRLAGICGEAIDIRSALAGLGVNPLIANAFRSGTPVLTRH
jgi:hypothetical protein